MASRKISDQEWIDARKRYENEPATGYGQIAASLNVSKTLVARRAAKRWQKRPVLTLPVDSQVPAYPDRGHLFSTPNRPEETVGVYAKAPEEVTVAPELNNVAGQFQFPSNLTPAERQEVAEQAVLARQTELIRIQAVEIRAVKKGIYEAVKAAGTERSYDAARSAKAVVEGMRLVHASERSNEIERVKLELGAFSGVCQATLRIIVHRIPCLSLAGDNSPAAIARRQGFALGQATSIEAGRTRDAAAVESRREATDVP